MRVNGHDDPGQAQPLPPVSEFLKDLAGRRAVVTGAARGIGEAIAKWLILAGAEVTVIDKDSHLLKGLPHRGLPGHRGRPAREDMVGVADELTRNGPVELVVNNVGITTPTGCWRSARQSSTWCSGRTRGGRGCSPTGW